MCVCRSRIRSLLIVVLRRGMRSGCRAWLAAKVKEVSEIGSAMVQSAWNTLHYFAVLLIISSSRRP